MKRFPAFVLVLCLAFGLLAPAFAEPAELDFSAFTVKVPEDFVVFTRENVKGEHPFAEYFNMDIVRAQFDADPTLYMDAYHFALGFDLIAVAVPLKDGLDLKATPDLLINTILLPSILKSYKDMGWTVLDSGIAHPASTTFMTVYFTDGANYVYQYYTIIPDGGAFLGVTFKIVVGGQEVTEEMLSFLKDMAETAVFAVYKAS